MARLALDRRIQVRRGTERDDGFSVDVRWDTTNPEADNHGAPIWAARRDLSDAERLAGGWIEATIACRFTVRDSGFARGVSAKDKVFAAGRVFDIQGVKEAERRGYLEITAIARADL